MRVLAVLPPDQWIEINLLDTLRQHYCEEVHIFTYPGGMGQLGSKLWRAQRNELNRRLVELARGLKAAGKLDLIFCIAYDDFLLVETAKQLRELRAPMVNYHVDMAFQWYRVIRTAPFFDVLAVAQMTNAEYLKPYAQHIHWMPMAANPHFYFRNSGGNTCFQHNLSFVGTFNPFRRALLAECVRNDLKPVVYGRGWATETPSPFTFSWDAYKVYHDLRHYALPRWKVEGVESLLGPVRRKYSRQFSFEMLEGADLKGPCEGSALPSIYAESQVNLGFSDTGWHSATEVRDSKNLQCRLRDFEVPMAGGLYLVQEAPDHSQYYKPGEEIVVWSEPGDFIDKALFYSQNERAAERIRAAGQRRVLGEHTWQHRFDRLFAHLGSLGRMS
ncbi:MAG: glycosyltransferase [Nitrospira sp.]|nr:glycosyltransferase [Nitrospira sp.]MDH4302468.1 glycosyltransferase [Nitrospira sp.]MDH5192246.1 glycosyltransferase [Nitrospira sp.]